MAARMSTACKLCYDKYSLKQPEKAPRKLQCNHIFCTECIEKLKQLQGLAIECPSCLTITTIPSQGVDYLPKDYNVLGIIEGSKTYEQCKHCKKLTYPPKSATLHCSDCRDVYCGSCSDKMHLKVENQDHVIRLANSFDDMKLIRSTSRKESSSMKSVSPFDEKRQLRRQLSMNSVCEQHGQELMLFCQVEQVRCCSRCKSTMTHKFHDCNFIQTNEEIERAHILDMQQELDEYIENYSKIRQDVQKIMEALKKNTVTSNENIRRCFRELRAVVDDAEKELMKEVTTIHDFKLDRLRKQCSHMIEVANAGMIISEKCGEACELEYFEMFAHKKKLEGEILQVCKVMEKCCPVENSDMFVQFPNHESMLTSIKLCAYLVRVPPPPSNFKCTLNEDSDVLLSWDLPKNLKYTYLPTLYAVYASVGENDTFLQIQKVSQKNYVVPSSHSSLVDKNLVQFQVAAINIIGESPPCFPLCIRLVKTRELED
ncbi:E3 ubiquitin-protein ligase TRIM71-like [Hydractinia symbiolongicarpus]|uniref:E3 ubiquitin-protein ligase TRIM71-like n=1 Tax=Hydractinia symbiolongicarpus TaxID=13093 RepID=UPI00254B44AE|nr:E3 ubiquitin-protein ligase TRIM71-like [Hydractinia symbiolongicarpus]